MSAPMDYALAIYRGDTYRWQFVLWQDADKTQPVDLTNVVVKATILQGTTQTDLPCTVSGNAILALLSAAASKTLAPDAPGTLGVPTPQDPAPARAGGRTPRATPPPVVGPQPSIWDLQLTYPDGTVKTPLAGDVLVQADVTV